MKSWIHEESGGLVQAEAYDARGKLVKEFRPTEIEKSQRATRIEGNGNRERPNRLNDPIGVRSVGSGFGVRAGSDANCFPGALVIFQS